MLSVIVAFPKIDDANRIRNILVRNGYEVALSCNNAARLLIWQINLKAALLYAVTGLRTCHIPICTIICPVDFQ